MSSPKTNKEFEYTEEEQNIATGLVNEAYQPLLALARARRRRVGMNATMMTEDILHDCFLKLSGKTIWQSQEQFMRTASLAIRQVIVEHARKKMSLKRGKGANNLHYDDNETVFPEYSESPEQILAIDELLAQLETKKPRLSKVVDARYFGGLTESETALALGISERTVRRDWQSAKAWLAKNID